MSAGEVFEMMVLQPGRPTGVFEATDDGDWRLKKIAIPEKRLPFDLGILPGTLTENGENLKVILIGEISLPPQSRVETRILGGFQLQGAELYLTGIPVVDERTAGMKEVDDLPGSLRGSVTQFIESLAGGVNSIKRLDSTTARSIVRKAVARLREVELASEQETAAKPHWRPVDRKGHVVGYTEVEHYTAAEYTYFQLPYRFQHYMDQHLANNERILFAISRPPMHSHLQGGWLRRKKLQEGVLILTEQRLLLLVELVPPDSSGVRYGFEASMGILERLEAVSIVKPGDEQLVLRTSWRAGDSVENLEWEFSMLCSSSLEELVGILSKFVAGNQGAYALRRASLPPLPETPPPLKDPAANDPAEVEGIYARFVSSLPAWLASDEKLMAWALLPAWFEKKLHARVLMVTNRRIAMIPDPATGLGPEIELEPSNISSLEYISSILISQISLSILDSGETRKVKVDFPYPAEHWFHVCFESVRQCVAITPG